MYGKQHELKNCKINFQKKMQHNIPCIKCGIEDEPEWTHTTQSLLETNNNWTLLRYMIILARMVQQRSNNSPITHSKPYECYDTDLDD